MPASYRLSPHAEEDFSTILYEIAEYSGWDRSMDIEESLYTAFRQLAANPGIGHLREDLLPRTLHVYYADTHMLVYLRDRDPIYIVAVLHGARDIAALMSDRLDQQT